MCNSLGWTTNYNTFICGAINVLRNTVGGGGVGGWVGVCFPGKKRYEGVRFNFNCITKGLLGVKSLGKKALRNT